MADNTRSIARLHGFFGKLCRALQPNGPDLVAALVMH
jgi:hypothetical protein